MNKPKKLSTPKGYENSKYDKDKGIKEGSKADIKRDIKGIANFKKAKKK